MSRAYRNQQPPSGTPPVILANREELDRQVKDATAQLCSGLSSPPHPAWRFYDIARGRYNPFAVPAEMLVGAIAAGQREENVWGFASVLTALVESNYPRIIAPVPEASLLETIKQCEADPAQQRASLNAGDDALLCDAERKSVAQLVALTNYITAIRAKRRANANARRTPRMIQVVR